MVERPSAVSHIEYVSSTGEYVVFTDEYGVVVNIESVVGEQENHIVGEVPVAEKGVGEVLEWGDLSYEVQEEVSSYVLNQTTDKGDRNEREAANLLRRVRGKGNVAKVSSYSNHDPFGLVDVIGVGEDWKRVLFVQVKTNNFTAKERAKYKRDMRRLNFESVRFEVWVRVDYTGWKMYAYNPDLEEFDLVLEMDTADHEATVEALREREGYYK
jgi:hypothetical protein